MRQFILGALLATTAVTAQKKAQHWETVPGQCEPIASLITRKHLQTQAMRPKF
jgi:hypothetical protein